MGIASHSRMGTIALAGGKEIQAGSCGLTNRGCGFQLLDALEVLTE